MEDFCANNPIKFGVLSELLQNNTADFVLDSADICEDKDDSNESRVDNVYKFEEFAPFINLDCVKTSGDDQEESTNKTPFEQMKQKMTNVTEEGKVSKFILRYGTGNVVPPKSVVYFHYNSYLEMEEIPFDSSYLRSEKPIRRQLGAGELYVGFEQSILTMQENEKSQFLVHPDYAFGKMGVPPRIPPEATILLEIELLKIVDCSGISISDEESTENDSFSTAYTKAKGYHALGNDFFGQGNIAAALEKYKTAEKILSYSSSKTKTDDEDVQCADMLLKLYLNLCVCYNHPKINAPDKVRNVASAAFLKCPKAKKSAKLFFNLGKAFIALNDYEKASRNLREALYLEPQNKNTNDLLILLEKKKKSYHEQEKSAYQNMFNFKKAPPEVKEENVKPVSKESDGEKLLREQLMIFSRNSTSRIQLPGGLTHKERALCRKLCEEIGLHYQESATNGKLSISITK